MLKINLECTLSEGAYEQWDNIWSWVIVRAVFLKICDSELQCLIFKWISLQPAKVDLQIKWRGW